MVAKRSFLILSLITSIASVQVMFEQFKPCLSNGVLTCNLRVRKLNRTLAVLTGNVSLHEDIGDEYTSSMNLYRSWLGNNQYNHYPMKISPAGVCKFMKEYWSDYYPYIVVYVPQLEKPGVCPITARYMQINDMILHEKLFPRWAPTGLWKMVWRADNNRTGKYFEVEAVFKVYQDGYF